MPEETFTPTQGAVVHQRPALLSFLCIVIFLGSLGGIIQNARMYFNAANESALLAAGESKTQLKNLFNLSDAHSPVNNSSLNEENFQKFSLGGILAAILCFVGSILMWRLHRNGFYAFVLGTFFNLITHFLLFGDKITSMPISILIVSGAVIMAVIIGGLLKNMDID